MTRAAVAVVIMERSWKENLWHFITNNIILSSTNTQPEQSYVTNFGIIQRQIPISVVTVSYLWHYTVGVILGAVHSVNENIRAHTKCYVFYGRGRTVNKAGCCVNKIYDVESTNTLQLIFHTAANKTSPHVLRLSQNTYCTIAEEICNSEIVHSISYLPYQMQFVLRRKLIGYLSYFFSEWIIKYCLFDLKTNETTSVQKVIEKLLPHLSSLVKMYNINKRLSGRDRF